MFFFNDKRCTWSALKQDFTHCIQDRSVFRMIARNIIPSSIVLQHLKTILILSGIIWWVFSPVGVSQRSPIVNFVIILKAAFAAKFLHQKSTNLKCKFKKRFARNFCTKKIWVKCWWNWHLVVSHTNWPSLATSLAPNHIPSQGPPLLGRWNISKTSLFNYNGLLVVIMILTKKTIVV